MLFAHKLILEHILVIPDVILKVKAITVFKNLSKLELWSLSNLKIITIAVL